MTDKIITTFETNLTRVSMKKFEEMNEKEKREIVKLYLKSCSTYKGYTKNERNFYKIIVNNMELQDIKKIAT